MQKGSHQHGLMFQDENTETIAIHRPRWVERKGKKKYIIKTARLLRVNGIVASEG